MWKKREGSSNEGSSRNARIASILAGAASRRDSGFDLANSDLAEKHPDLMPELGERLRLLQGIRRAADRARQLPTSTSSANDAAPLFEESRRFLREALPGYEILDGVHYGGQGVVHKAFQIAAKRVVAVKVLLDGPLASPRQRYRFEREIEFISRLRHPNIVTLYDSGIVRGRHYCTMEFVDGLTIDDYVLVEDLTVHEVVRLFTKVCRAVNYAHQRGVIHRDINPANILVDMDGEPHILDFGLAKDAGGPNEDQAGQAITVSGQFIGTLPYLSPEQAGGLDGQADVRSDIYALGVTLFTLLADAFPYSVQGDPATVRDHIVSAEALTLRKVIAMTAFAPRRGSQAVTRDLETILAKTLSKEKELRYQSAGELADDLDRYLAGDAIHARTTSGVYLLRKTLRRYRGYVIAAVLLLVVLASSAAAVMTLWIQARAQRENAREVARVAHSALSGVVTEIDEAIRPLAGGTEVRNRLLGEVAENLDRLQPLVENDGTMNDVLATLREKQGDIAVAEGRISMAREHYEASLERAAESAIPEGQLPPLQIQAARVHRKLAEASEAPADHYERAIELARSALQQGSDVSDAEYELCRARIDFAIHLCNRGVWEAAAAQVAQARPVAEVKADGTAANLRWTESLATACSLDGRIQKQLGNASAARQSLAEALVIRERMSRRYPANTGLRHKWLVSHVLLSEVYRDAGRFDEARALLVKAMELGEYLTEVDPGCATWKYALFSAHDYLAQLDMKAGNLEQAQLHSDLAMDIAEALVKADPTNITWRRVLASARSVRGRLLRSRGDAQSALKEFSAALILREDLAAADPDALGRQAELASACDDLGMCSRVAVQMEAALENYQRAYEIRKRLLAQSPTIVQRSLDVILSLTKLATWHLDQDSSEEDRIAHDLLSEAERLLNGLQDSGRLEAHQGIFRTWMDAIEVNQKLIERRDENRRRAKGSETLTISQPTLAPQR